MKKLLLLIACCLVLHGSINADDELIASVIAGDARRVEMALSKPGVNVNEKWPYGGNTPLHYAVMKSPDMYAGSPALAEHFGEIVNLLLDAGADFDLENDDGRTPLQEAALYHYAAGARLIIDRIAQKQAEAKLGASASLEVKIRLSLKIADELFKLWAFQSRRAELKKYLCEPKTVYYKPAW